MYQILDGPVLPLLLAAGDAIHVAVAYRPTAVSNELGWLRILTEGLGLPEVSVLLDGAGGVAGAGCDAPPQAGLDVKPVITMSSSIPPDGANGAYLGTCLFGDPISFHARDEKNNCVEDCFQVCWYFRKLPDIQGDPIPDWNPPYQFTEGRLFGCGTLMPMPGSYEVKVKMCGVESDTNGFEVLLGPGLLGQSHREGQRLCFLDWDDPAYQPIRPI